MVVLAVAPGMVAAVPYTYTSYTATQTDGTLYAYSSPAAMGRPTGAFKTAHFMDTPASVTSNFYGIYGTLLGTKTVSGTNCISSFPFYYNLTGLYEITSGLPANSNTTFSVTYTYPNTAPEFDVLVNGSEVDAFGNVPLRQFLNCGSLGFLSIGECVSYEASQALLDMDYGSCRAAGGNFPLIPSAPENVNVTNNMNVYMYAWAYPFNSSSGKISVFINSDNGKPISYCSGLDGWINYEVYLVNTETQAVETVLTYPDMNCAGNPVIDNITFTQENLSEDTKYFLFIGGVSSAWYWPTDKEFYEPSVNISVGMEYPNWECSPWDECFNGIQTRICHDTTETFLADRTEIRNCSAAFVPETALLGFEASTPVIVTSCQPKNNGFGGCEYHPGNTWLGTNNLKNETVLWPSGWLVAPSEKYGSLDYNPYFAQITNEWHTEGSSSLKLWRIPSDGLIPGEGSTFGLGYGFTCVNSSNSIEPYVYAPIDNTSMSVVHSITFPAENMLLTFDAKACDELPERTPEYGYWGAYCNRTCYGKCGGENIGNLLFNVYDNETGASVIGFNRLLTLPNGSQFAPYLFEIHGAVPGNTYNIQFSPYTDSPFSYDGNCVMVDNVRYQVVSEDYTNSIGGCETGCRPGTLDYYTSETIEGSCYLTVEKVSPKCIADTEAQNAAANKNDFCLNGLFYTYNAKIGNWETPQPDNPQCAAKEIAENATAGNLGIPADNPLAPLNNLLSLTFISFFLNIVIGGGVAVMTKNAPLALVATIGTALVFSFIGLYPLVVAVVIVILTAALAAYEIRKPVVGG